MDSRTYNEMQKFVMCEQRRRPAHTQAHVIALDDSVGLVASGYPDEDFCYVIQPQHANKADASFSSRLVKMQVSISSREVIRCVSTIYGDNESIKQLMHDANELARTTMVVLQEEKRRTNNSARRARARKKKDRQRKEDLPEANIQDTMETVDDSATLFHQMSIDAPVDGATIPRDDVDVVDDAFVSASARDLSNAKDDPPDDLVCPISMEVMCDAVITSTGQCYQAHAIEAYMRHQGAHLSTYRCPKTGASMSANLTPCYSVRSLARDWLSDH